MFGEVALDSTYELLSENQAHSRAEPNQKTGWGSFCSTNYCVHVL